MSKSVFRGVQKSHEAINSANIRDTRPLRYKIKDFLLGSRSGPVFMVVLAVLMVFIPALFDLFFVMSLFVFCYIVWDLPVLPFKLPMNDRYADRNNPKPGSAKEPGKSEGIYYFGNERNTDKELWFSNSDMRTHALILGTTGSGKTEALISIASNALMQGSGFIYVDGKGDNALYAKIYSMAKAMGREDDLLVVNYMTGAKDVALETGSKTKLSNTLNPFALGSSDMLAQLVVSMMSSNNQSGGSDGDMWKGRAISFVEALMRLLVYMRDKGYLLLDAGLIRRYFILDVLEDLLEKKLAVDQNGNQIQVQDNFPVAATDPMYNYLATLPGYQRKNVGKQSEKTYEQHGYITMQLTRIFGSLADVYGHIMKTNLAEVDFKDVVLNRRILVVLLPALEKAPDELANLGKLIIASLKAMLAAGLGSQIEGRYEDVIESKPSNSNTPFLCVLDEYGYYAVQGFAVVPAQARSLGFSVVFAGQDIPAFQKASKEEAASIFANTNIKVCMKLEDPTETWDFFNKGAGEAYVSVAREYNLGTDGGAFNYRDSKVAAYEKRARIDLMDLKDQGVGESHIFFRSSIIRAKMYYAAPARVSHIRVNQFLKVLPLSYESLESIKSILRFNVTNEYKRVETPEYSDKLVQILDMFSEYKGEESVAWAEKQQRLLEIMRDEHLKREAETDFEFDDSYLELEDKEKLDMSESSENKSEEDLMAELEAMLAEFDKDMNLDEDEEVQEARALAKIESEEKAIEKNLNDPFNQSESSDPKEGEETEFLFKHIALPERMKKPFYDAGVGNVHEAPMSMHLLTELTYKYGIRAGHRVQMAKEAQNKIVESLRNATKLKYYAPLDQKMFESLVEKNVKGFGVK